jgi:hypothetical protein
MLLLAAVPVLLFSGTAQALTQDQVKAFQSGVRYFNTEEDVVAQCAVGAILSGDDNKAKIWNFFISKGLSPLQAAGFMGNIQAESGFNPGIIEGGSGIGFGIVQWSFGRRTALEDAARAKGVDPADLAFQLDFLWNELQSSYGGVYQELTSAATLEAATYVILEKYEIPADIPGQRPVRLGFAQGILDQFGSSSTPGAVTGGVSTGGCASGAVNGNIVATALGLAWPDGGHGTGCAAATPAYQAARAQYVPEDPTGCTGCDVFLSTVMQAAGIDPNYTHLQTSQQLKYVREHPEKYDILGETTGNSIDPKLQPGDILINGDIATGHTLVYVGDQPGGFNMVDGSNGQHVPQPNHWGGGGWVGTYSIVRVKG